MSRSSDEFLKTYCIDTVYENELRYSSDLTPEKRKELQDKGITPIAYDEMVDYVHDKEAGYDNQQQ